MPYADTSSAAAKASAKRGRDKYYSANREKQIAKSAAYNKAHKEHVNAMAVERRSKKLPPSKVLYNNAKQRAKKYSLPFNITVEDIVVPENCPILGIPLIIQTGCASDNSPSLDKIIPELGYVKGNIQVISHKANSIKNNASVQDLEKVYLYMKGLLNG